MYSISFFKKRDEESGKNDVQRVLPVEGTRGSKIPSVLFAMTTARTSSKWSGLSSQFFIRVLGVSYN
jgi:hypothetical protein